MPDLDILDKSQDDALAEVMEKIIFPNDEHLADCYHYIRISKKHVADDLFWSELSDPTTGWLRARYVRSIMNKLLNCPSLCEMKKIQDKAFAESFVVGLVMMNMYKMYLLGEEASLGKAAYATRIIIEKLQISLPKSNIEKKVRAKRSSAHLAAALVLYFSSIGKIDIGDLDELTVMLSTAKQFYDFGVKYTPPNQKQPIFSGDMWTIPNDYPLVEVDLPSKTTDDTLISAISMYQNNKEWEGNW